MSDDPPRSARLERALRNAEFEPDAQRVWRWRTLLHNDAGGDAAAAAVLDRFGSELESVRTALDDLRDNFADTRSQGPAAYADEMLGNHPELNHRTLLADAATAVGEFRDVVIR